MDLRLSECSSVRFGMALIRPAFRQGMNTNEQLARLQYFTNVEVPRRYRRETENPFRKLARWWRPELAVPIAVTASEQARLRQAEQSRQLVHIDLTNVVLAYGPQDRALAAAVESMRDAHRPEDATQLAKMEADLADRTTNIELGPVPKRRRWGLFS